MHRKITSLHSTLYVHLEIDFQLEKYDQGKGAILLLKKLSGCSELCFEEIN